MSDKKTGNVILRTIVVAASVFVVIFVLSHLIEFILSTQLAIKAPLNEDFVFFQIILSSLNSVLLIYLLYDYLQIYYELKSSFTLGLIFLIIALFSNAITSNPLFHGYFGLKVQGLEHFTIIPSIFTIIASLVLIHLSRK